ncbi:putative ubiquitin carboxyl-terminal hydrolase 2 [Diplonema papillatum]|nr:putative ubiquitin carboxyl-terminal hydrolase 2 [Diplonema papillatum]
MVKVEQDDPVPQELVDSLVEMGFPQGMVVEALQKNDRDVQKAAEWLTRQPAKQDAGADQYDPELYKALQDSLQTMSQGGGAVSDVYSIVQPPDQLAKADPSLPVGLQNVGNTCYANTFFQLFFALGPFRELLLAFPAERKPSFMAALRLAFARMQHSAQAFVNPKDVIEKLSDPRGQAFSIGGEQDVSEFTDKFLAGLEAEFESHPDPALAAAFKRALRGVVEGSVSELYEIELAEPTPAAAAAAAAGGSPGSPGKKVKAKIDFFRSVVLPVSATADAAGESAAEAAVSLHDLLEQHTSREVIENFRFEADDGQQGGGGGGAATAVQAVKSTWFRSLPPVLNVQLQRVLFAGGAPKKNNRRVQCPYVLRMDRYLETHADEVTAARQKAAEYKAVLIEARRRVAALHNVQNTGRSLSELVAAVASCLREEQAEQGHPACLYGLDIADVVRGLSLCADESKAKIEAAYKAEAVAQSTVDGAFSHIPADDAAAYKLVGFLVHEGTLPQTGHYWACAYHTEQGKWYKYSDTYVTPLAIEEVDSFVGEGGNGATDGLPLHSSICSVLYAKHGFQMPYSESLASLEGVAAEVAEKSELSAADVLGMFRARVAELKEVVEKENDEHAAALSLWNKDMAALPNLVLKEREECDAGALFAAGSLVQTGPVFDRRITSIAAFAAARHRDDDVWSVLPVVLAYKKHFNSELISDWRGQTHASRAERVALDSGVSSLLAKSESALSKLRSSHVLYLKAAERYRDVLACIADPTPDFMTGIRCVYEFIKEKDRLDDCWKDTVRHECVILAFSVRWLAAVCEEAAKSFDDSSVLKPLGLIGRLSLELSWAETRAALQSMAVRSVKSALCPILASYLTEEKLLSQFQTGCNPPLAGSVPTPADTQQLAEAIFDLERRIFDPFPHEVASLLPNDWMQQ